MIFSDRTNSIETSKTVEFTTIIRQLNQQGKNIIDLAVGEPQFNTPDAVLEATKKALDDQKTRYGPVLGLQELRIGIAKQFDGYDAQNILISNGSKQSLFLVFQALFNPGDEIIVPRPFWVSFTEQIKLAGAAPVLVDTNNHQLDVKAISDAITSKTKAIIINTPNNPTGAVYKKADIEAVIRLAVKNNFLVISDEAYNFLVYDELKTQTLFNYKEARDSLIITNSFSKKYNMTGFRVGYAAAHRDIINAMAKIQSHCSGNVCTFAQHGALASLSMDEEFFLKRKAALEKKRDIAWLYVSGLFDCIKPQGAFYIFPNIAKHLNGKQTSLDFAGELLNKTGVAVVPGEAFGMPGHIRISYAVPDDVLIKGFEKISEYIISNK